MSIVIRGKAEPWGRFRLETQNVALPVYLSIVSGSQGDYQKFMSQYASDYQKYMQGGTSRFCLLGQGCRMHVVLMRHYWTVACQNLNLSLLLQLSLPSSPSFDLTLRLRRLLWPCRYPDTRAVTSDLHGRLPWSHAPGQGKGGAGAGDYQKYMSDFQQYMKGHGGRKGLTSRQEKLFCEHS